MQSYLNNNSAQTAQETKLIREAFDAKVAALRAELIEKQAALQQKQTAGKELNGGRQETPNRKTHVKVDPRPTENLEAEIENLAGEINSLAARFVEVQAQMDKAKPDVGMADPVLRNLHDEAAFLETQLWVKGLTLELKKDALPRRKEEAPHAVEKLKHNGTAADCDFQEQRRTEETTSETIAVTRGEEEYGKTTFANREEPPPEAFDAEIQLYRTDISGLIERITRMESTSVQAWGESEDAANQIQEKLKAEIAALKDRLKEKEAALQAERAAVGQLEHGLKATIEKLEAQLAAKQTALQARDDKLRYFKSDIDILLKRIAQLESGVERAQAEAESRVTRIREESRAEASSLLAQLTEREQALALARGHVAELEEKLVAKESAVRDSEQRFNSTLEKLRSELAAKAAALNDSDEAITGLRAQIRSLEEQAIEIESAFRETQRAADGEREKVREEFTAEAAALRSRLAERDAALNDQQITLRDLELALSAKIKDLEIDLAEKQVLLVSRDSRIADLQRENADLTERLSQTASALKRVEGAEAGSPREESEALQENPIVTGEFGQLVGANGAESHALMPTGPAAREEAERILKGRINELETQLTEKQALAETRNGEIVRLKYETERLVERNDQMWAAARQAQAEAEREVKRVREGLEAEVASLEAQLRKAEEAGKTGEAIGREGPESFNAWLKDLQKQLAEKQAVLESRNDEIEALKSKVKQMVELLAQPEAATELMEAGEAGELGPVLEDGSRDVETHPAAECGGGETCAVKPADIIDLKKEDEANVCGAEPQSTLEQPFAQDCNGDARDAKDDLPVPTEGRAADIVLNGQSLPFSLFNLPPRVERATDLFPLKFMQQYKFFPLKLQNGSFAVAMSDPSDVYTLDSIGLQAGPDVQVYAGDERQIMMALDRHYGPSSSMERIIRDIDDEEGSADDAEGDIAHLKDLASEAPVIRLVNLVIAKAVEERASDIHIEPFEGSLRVRYRIDGLLVDAESPPPRLQAAIVSRVKLMAKMNIAERRLPQDGRIMMDVGGRQLDLRVSAIPTLYGESVVMRLLDRSSVLLAPDDLGFPADIRQSFDGLIRRPNGIILVTGPTGSGKTTTLYAALSSINSIEKNIITVEDPVEYQLKGVKQIQVRPRIGLTFATGLRHIVRQDPDVILVGEIRDQETADIAIHAALTGHLVLSTLHTNDAAGAVTRLLDMGIQNYLVSSTLLAVLAQRLVRRICPHCKSPYSPDKETLAQLDLSAAEKQELVLYKGRGCDQCSHTGYFGRLGIFELLVIEGDLQRLILKETDSGSIRQKAVEMGMQTLWRDGLEKVVGGVTTLEEVLRVTWET